MKSSDFQTEFCSIVSLCIVNAWKYTQCVIWIYACARVRCHLSSSRAQAQCQAGRGYFARSPPFLVYVPKVKIAPLKETKKQKNWDNKGSTCLYEYHKGSVRREEKNETTIHLHNQLGQEGKQRMLANNKHNKSQVSDNHSNDDNHQPSKQRENKVWTNYMLVNFTPIRHTQRIELAMAERLTMINCPYLRSY